MNTLQDLFDRNRKWAEGMTSRDPEFFQRLSRQQAPKYLWIGCADSRVPANEIIGVLPGELFVHRNVSNLVVYTDLNCLTVLQYAVEVLKVRHIIVCGHYGCGGVEAAWSNQKLGLSDNWLRYVQEVRQKHHGHLQELRDERRQVDRLCELNVLEQVVHTAYTTVVQDAWARHQELSIHGWIYRLTDGLLRDLGLVVTRPDDLPGRYDDAARAAKAVTYYPNLEQEL
jgi:carbonic anhydrase